VIGIGTAKQATRVPFDRMKRPVSPDQDYVELEEREQPLRSAPLGWTSILSPM
jgi:hypothetical protein